MSFTNDIKSTFKLTADAVTDVTSSVVEKARLKAKATRIKQVIKSDTERRNQAYMELGKLFYENHKDLAQELSPDTFEVVEKTTIRIDKASRRYFELITQSDNITLSSENTDKIKQAITDKTEEISTKTKAKATEISDKTKAKAEEFSQKTKAKAQEFSQKTKSKAKEVASDFADKAKDKIDDFKSYVNDDEESPEEFDF